MEQARNVNIIYFLYARKSSESEDRQIQSIDDQIERLRDLASTHGWMIKEVLTEAHSAKQPNSRPIFNTMLNRIEKGEANGILCWQINRLSRNPVDSARIQWLLQQGVIQSIQTVDGERKPSDNAVLLSVEAGVSNQFILDHIKNVRRGMESKLAKGWLPCRPRIGYINDPSTNTIIPDPDRFHLVRKMWDLILTDQYSVKKVLDIATNTWGFRTKKFKRSGGKPISLSWLYSTLTSPFYCGIISYAGKEYKGQHTAMITVEEYDRVQHILGRAGRPRSRKHTFAYQGVFRCHECGCLITAEQKRKVIKATGKVKEYTYYHCTRKKRTVICSQRNSISEEEITRQIFDVFQRYTISPDFHSWALEDVKRERSEQHNAATVLSEKRQSALDSVVKQLNILTGMRYRELIDDDQFIQEKELLNHQIVKLKLSIQQYERKKAKGEDLLIRALEFSACAQESFMKGTPQLKREIIRGLCSNPTLKDRKLNIEAAEWLDNLGTDHVGVEEKSYRLEPENNRLTEVKECIYQYYIPQWSTTLDVIRTILSDPDKDFYIPDLVREQYDDTKEENLRKAG